MAEGGWDILGDVPKALYLGRVGSERVGGDQSLTMPDAAVSPVTRMLGAHPVTAADEAQAQHMANVMAGMDTAGSIRAFHGSPYAFEKFDPAKIGTGEGAQAYGHGLYFAEDEGVATNYRNNVGRAKSPDIGPKYDAFQSALSELWDAKRAGVEPSQELVDKIEATRKAYDDAHAAMGHTYEVALHADPEHMLDWDKPLSEQSEKVQAAVEALGITPEKVKEWGALGTGETVMRTGTQMTGKSQADISSALRDAGIPGIRYLDAGSRANAADTLTYDGKPFDSPATEKALGGAAGDWGKIGRALRAVQSAESIPQAIAQLKSQGYDSERIAALERHADKLSVKPPTRNYVVFDPNLIEILRRYGIPGMIAGGVAHSLDWAPVNHEAREPGDDGNGDEPPPEALDHLIEGHATRFRNGQVWTMENGRPIRVGGGQQ